MRRARSRKQATDFRPSFPAKRPARAWRRPWRDRAAVLQSARDFAATGAKLTRLAFPRTEVQAYGDSAFVYSLYEFDLDGPNGKRSAAGRATEIFVRQGGRWVHPGWHLDSGQ